MAIRTREQISPDERLLDKSDLLNETVLTAREACRHRLLRRGDRPLDRSVLERWWTIGLLGPARKRIVLESARLGGKRVTSTEAVQRFLRRMNGEDPVAPTRAQIRQQHDRAERELSAAGM